MYKKIINKLENKNIAILGFGREGKSTYNFIRKYLPTLHLTIIDKNPVDLVDDFTTIITGDSYLDNLGDYDLIIKSPGISLKDIDITLFKDKISSQVELLLEVFRDNIIGVTGTKGKSTTSSLIYSVLKDQGKDTYLLGNIGTPVFDQIENYNKDTILVVEMSSHQLEFIKTSPHIAIILNLYQDHLDHAGSLEHYHANKMNIFKFQTTDDYTIYSEDNVYLSEQIKAYPYQGKKYPISFAQDTLVHLVDNKIYLENELLYTDSKRNLLGEHNLKNIMFVMTVCKILNLDLAKAKETIVNFKGLKYRMEYIGTYDGISYYNDTIATIPEATISAIKAIGNVDTLIFGGLNREIDYSQFIEFLNSSAVNNFICMPTTGYLIGKKMEENTTKNIYYAKDLDEAYHLAVEKTSKGMSCLLSPAAASYEFYKNFEEKGHAFELLVTQKEK